MVGINIDITDQKQAEEQIACSIPLSNPASAERTRELSNANHELESFSYSVSHDLRAPLRTIDGFSMALLEDCGEGLDDACKGHLQRIRAAAQRMGLLIDSLLNLSRVTRAQLSAQPCDLSAIVTASRRTCKPRSPLGTSPGTFSPASPPPETATAPRGR